VQQLGRFNILICIFHEWAAIAHDMWHSPWRHKLSYFFAPPGWSHDGSRETSDQIKARWRSLNADTGQKQIAMEGEVYDRTSQSN
jgi:hypothetical protein